MVPSKLDRSKFASGRAYGRARIEELITYGKTRAAQVLQFVQSLQPIDRVVRADKMVFSAEGDNHELLVRLPKEKAQESLHNNAMRQAASKAGIPWDFVEKLRAHGDWGKELLAENLSEIFSHNEERVLLRSIGSDVRAILSNRYRRIDSRPLVDAFAKICHEVGALPYEGYATDTKIAIQAIIPKVYEPFGSEFMAYGVSFENSDFGNGALNISIFILRLYCDNGAIGADHMRKVHLGKRLEEEVEWSKETYELDQKTMISATQDMVRGNLTEDRIETMQALIRQAAETQLTDDRRKSTIELLKKYMSKIELDKAMKKFNEPDIELLPAGNNMWRMSNAISWLAGEVEDEERKLELQKMAGRLLPEMPKAA